MPSTLDRLRQAVSFLYLSQNPQLLNDLCTACAIAYMLTRAHRDDGLLNEIDLTQLTESNNRQQVLIL